MNTSDAPLHVILGAGQVGARLAALLRSRGLQVRQVRRSGASSARVVSGCLAWWFMMES